ncbi:MAG TPA: TadE/TadG family type IV pilus assembly protein [Actinomycetota bacterium]|jgi:Flp pilus assembly protein TadG
MSDVSGRAHRSREEGAAAVEFAIVASLLFLLVFGIIDFGFGFHAWDASSNGAREGARLAAVNPDTTAIVARVRAATSFLDQSLLTVTVTCSHNGGGFAACGPSSTWAAGDLVRVAVAYRYDYMTPLPVMVGLGSDLMVRASSESRFEGS